MTTKRTPETELADASARKTTRQSNPDPIISATAYRPAARVWLLSATISFISLSSQAQFRSTPNGTLGPIAERLQQSASVFVENRGQWSDSSIRFAAKAGGVNVGVTDTGLRFQVFRPEASLDPNETVSPVAEGSNVTPADTSDSDYPSVRPTEFSVQFVGARRVMPEGEAPARAVFHFQQGAPEQWRENVPSWKTVIYRGLYEGIDLRVTCDTGMVQYEFTVAPGADWRQVRMQYRGIERSNPAADGTSELSLEDGRPALSDRALIIRQESGTNSLEVAERLDSVAGQTVALAVSGRPEPTQALVIEGQIEWSLALGGTGNDSAKGITVDRLGNILVTGATPSTGWITVPNTETTGGSMDAFVAKLDPDGDVIWSRYFGGVNVDLGRDITMDSADNVLVAGTTASGGWVRGGYETVKFYDNPLEQDPFVMKLTPNGEHVWSTYVGNGDLQTGAGIAVDQADNVLVTGSTFYLGWATTQVRDGYLVKLTPNGGWLWTAYLGDVNAYPNLPDGAYGVAVDGRNNVLVVGYTTSAGWMRGGADSTFNGGTDAFVVKYNPEGKRVWSTYLGGFNQDTAAAVAVDSADNVLVGGSTYSGGWIYGGFDTTWNGAEDGFVVKLTPDGAIAWSTYLGGLNADQVHGVASDGAGNVYAVGSTSSSGWIQGGANTTYQGQGDGFVFALTAAGTNLWSTYLGGEAQDYCNDIALDPAGNLLVVGDTLSTGWTTVPFDPNLLRGKNAFVAKLRAPSGNTGCRLATPEPRVPRRGRVGTTNPTLWWADVSDESGYVVKVYAGTRVYTSAILRPDTTSVTLPDSLGLEQTNVYSWQVKAVGDGALTCDSSWSRLFTFKVQTNLARDVFPPTVQITSPQPLGPFYQKVYNQFITVWGKASDNRAVAEVRYRLNGGNSVQANGAVTWNAAVLLQPGYNVFQAFAVDGSGLVSTNDRLRLFYVVPSPLLLVTNGEGSIVRRFQGTNLVIGIAYKVRAVPAPGYVFSHWSGSVTWTNPSNPVLNFIMESNLVIEATFVPTISGSVFGSVGFNYQGLIFAGATTSGVGVTGETTAPVEAATSGFATLTVTRHGVASGAIVFAGQRYSFSGMRFDANGSGHVQLKCGTQPSPPTMDLQFDLASGARTLSGKISGDGWRSDLRAFRTERSSTQAGRYTFVLSGGAADDAAAPAGYGAGVITVSADGSVRLAGRLADGTPVSRASGQSGQGWWPLYLPLQAGRGMMLGWDQFASNAGGYDLLGTNLWLKAAAVRSEACCPDGFVVSQELWGARYQAPPRGQSVQDWTSGVMTFAEGDLAMPLTPEVAWVNNLLVIRENRHRVRVRVNLSNGLFSGRLVHPGTGKMTQFRGALLQRPGWGAGWFLGTNRPGSIRIDPAQF